MRTSTALMTTRARPAWARTIRHLGEDIRWALDGWVDVPRPSRRTVLGVSSVFCTWAFGGHDLVDRVLATLGA